MHIILNKKSWVELNSTKARLMALVFGHHKNE
jgi:hypothetical protein